MLAIGHLRQMHKSQIYTKMCSNICLIRLPFSNIHHESLSTGRLTHIITSHIFNQSSAACSDCTLAQFQHLFLIPQVLCALIAPRPQFSFAPFVPLLLLSISSLQVLSAVLYLRPQFSLTPFAAVQFSFAPFALPLQA